MTAFAEACKKTGTRETHGTQTLQLKTLWLGNNDIADLGVHAFISACAAGSLPKLETLLLHTNPLTDSCLIGLGQAAASGAFAQLKCLCLQGAPGITKLGRDNVRYEAAQAAAPGGKGSPHLKVYC